MATGSSSPVGFHFGIESSNHTTDALVAALEKAPKQLPGESKRLFAETKHLVRETGLLHSQPSG